MAAGAPRGYTEQQFMEAVDYIDRYIEENQTQEEYIFEVSELNCAITGHFLASKAFITRLMQVYQEAEPKWGSVHWRPETTTYGEDAISRSHTIEAALCLERED